MDWIEWLMRHITFHEWCILWFGISILLVCLGKLWMDVAELKEEMSLIRKSVSVKKFSGISEMEARSIEAEYAAERSADTESFGG